MELIRPWYEQTAGSQPGEAKLKGAHRRRAMEPQVITKMGSTHLADNLFPLVRRLRGGKSKVPNRMKKEKDEQGVVIAGKM